ncbi:MAG: hypothetical protein F6K26_16310 [Moorea sp. SIO2I5]|nr:hypothetical protein [Moorena sp. SIO2I5]
MGRWGNGEIGKWGDREMGRWGDGINLLKFTAFPLFPVPYSLFPVARSQQLPRSLLW